MSIPDIVLEDIYRRLRELEEEVKQLRKAHQVYGPVRPLPAVPPSFPSMPVYPGPQPVYGETDASDCMYERAAKSGQPFAGICNCPRHRMRLGGSNPPTGVVLPKMQTGGGGAGDPYAAGLLALQMAELRGRWSV